MTFLDFFAGVGGFRRGLELAGHKCIGFCEWDKYATMSYTSMHLITDKQRKYLATLPLKQRQKEILKEEYRNGEWYSNDIRNVNARNVPKADCWCFGAPCQDFSLAGKRKGLDGDRSSLVREIFRILEEIQEEDRPEWLIYENVKGMFSSNRGLDYLSILSAMDEGGYDIEWQNINTSWFLPQNRERIYTIGHFRARGRRKVLPIQGTDGENCVQQIGSQYCATRDNPQRMRTYDIDGIAPCLHSMQGGNLEPQVALPIPNQAFCDLQIGGGIKLMDKANCIKARYEAGVTNFANDNSGVALVIDEQYITDLSIGGGGKPSKIVNAISSRYDAGVCKHQRERTGVAIPVSFGIDDLYANREPRFYEEQAPTLRSDRQGLKVGVEVEPKVKVKEATKQGYAECRVGGVDSVNLAFPNSETRRGRVQKDMAGTLDTSCNQGIFVKVSDKLTVYAIWYEKYQCYIAIRKLTPKECFRLQGWTDDYFEKAEFVNSNSQLYKQAGNGISIPVVEAIGRKIGV